MTSPAASLSSDLLMRVANYLSVKELCVFDIASENNKQLRAKYLSGLISDDFLYAGADVDNKTAEWQERYAQWLTMRHVFVKSITLNARTTAKALWLYDTMNRVNSGLVCLTIDGKVEMGFPKDMAVRNKTLHKLIIKNQGESGSASGTASLRKLMGSVCEWGSVGGSLQVLELRSCRFGNETVDFGGGDALTDLTIWDCHGSRLSTTPGDSNGYSLLIEAALMCVAMKCTKLETLWLRTQIPYADRTIQTIATNSLSLRVLYIEVLQLHNPRTLRCLARGCPLLWYLEINQSNVSEAELLYLVGHAKRLNTLTIGKWGHLDFRERWDVLQPDNSAAELVQLGMEDPEALLSSQRDRLQVMSAATQQQAGDMDATDTLDRLKAASSNSHFTVTLV
ncbi:hypothetical protein B484DRAFT_398151 [Ochromonadaceae sp. CCMP2298]|nr:hypothetical protein B484DRAFT_398151 [Ochromonadaceae sp. CCMP2298]